jgi:hypothetical protein
MKVEDGWGVDDTKFQPSFSVASPAPLLEGARVRVSAGGGGGGGCSWDTELCLKYSLVARPRRDPAEAAAVERRVTRTAESAVFTIETYLHEDRIHLVQLEIVNNKLLSNNDEYSTAVRCTYNLVWMCMSV